MAAVAPHLVGAYPDDSLVVFPTRPGAAPVARVDLPQTAAEREEMAQRLQHAYAGRFEGDVVLLAFTDRLDLAEAGCDRLRAALEPSMCVVAACAVQGENWVRLDQPDSGVIDPSLRERYAAEYVLLGQRSPYQSLEDMRASFRTTGEGIGALLPTGVENAREVVLDPQAKGVEKAWISLTLDRFVATTESLADPDAARLAADASSLQLRDHAWAAITREVAPAHAAMWKDLLTRTPEQAAAPVASMTAFAYWLSGDGAQARAALSRVPAIESYSMTGLVQLALNSGMDPARWIPPPSAASPSVEAERDASPPSPNRRPEHRQAPTMDTERPSPGPDPER